MKAVILAAGRGSRINSVSKNRHKSLLPIENTTILGKSLINFWSEGIRDIVVVTGYQTNALKYIWKIIGMGNLKSSIIQNTIKLTCFILFHLQYHI